MTGFGRASAQDERLEITVEIFSVNRRNLELSISLPKEWQGMERELNEVLRQSAERGKVSVNIQAKQHDAGEGLNWDDSVIETTVERLRKTAERIGIPFQADAELLLRLISSMGSGRELPGSKDSLALVKSALGSALEAFVAMREAEGLALAEDLRARIGKLLAALGTIRTLSADSVPRYRELLLQRLQKADIPIDPDDERFLKEIAFFADRCDITEEITRLESHFDQFLGIIGEAGSIGRKLDFLCQEINRELNTIGSKANNLEVTRLVIEGKNELERIREQVQNIE